MFTWTCFMFGEGENWKQFCFELSLSFLLGMALGTMIEWMLGTLNQAKPIDSIFPPPPLPRGGWFQNKFEKGEENEWRKRREREDKKTKKKLEWWAKQGKLKAKNVILLLWFWKLFQIWHWKAFKIDVTLFNSV